MPYEREEEALRAFSEDERVAGVTKLAAAPRCELLPGVHALAGGLLYLEGARALLAADIHFGYEEIIGGALPLWSIDESLSHLRAAHAACDAREILLLGDVIHGSRMSEGAERRVFAALEALRDTARLTLLAGNHEGRSRGRSLLGETFECVERDGWTLCHGDVVVRDRKTIIGHLHPSLHLGGRGTAPAFLSAPSLVVVPALTPYSPGLDVLSRECATALHPWMARGESLRVTGVAGRQVYPFGELEELRSMLASPQSPRKRAKSVRSYHRRKPFQPDDSVQ